MIFPEKGNGPFPVIFCVHGSDNWAGHHHEHILNFLEAGFAIFRVHSFDSRGVASTVEDQMSVTAAMMMVDTFEALKIVSRHPDIDSSRIGITGWSLGGTVSFYSFSMTCFLEDEWIRDGDQMCEYDNGTVLNVGIRLCPLSIDC